MRWPFLVLGLMVLFVSMGSVSFASDTPMTEDEFLALERSVESLLETEESDSKDRLRVIVGWYCGARSVSSGLPYYWFGPNINTSAYKAMKACVLQNGYTCIALGCVQRAVPVW